ncbi:NAD(P)H-binding protein [Nocardioides sp. GY 10113]|uniref:SDR family oxidoreductase n=1 Tax=Nocardioides sp. GY 10113 TaxID=2569761 RepID=UPI00197D27B2|nr:NAD(P)H-binding protein [Nocardioides sp. GY 10113]
MVSLAVAGGTGVVGRLVVDAARRRGHEVTVLARSTGVDLTSGAGVDEAMAGVERVVDVTNLTTLRARRAVAFFDGVTQRLLGAAERAGVEHVVALSVVGCDRVDLGYYLGKRAQESALAAGPVPWTLLRATQFYEFANLAIDHGPPGLVVAQRMRCQPIAAAEVAEALVDAVEGPPAGRLPDLAGPREHQLDQLVRQIVVARGLRRAVVSMPLPGSLGRQVREGGLLPTADAGDPVLGTEPFEDWLARVYPQT